MSELIYCATPSRLVHHIEGIMDSVTAEGNAPFHPFQAFPYERFEGNPKIGRKNSMDYCKRAIEICDKFRLFGISDGTLEESVYAIQIAKPFELNFAFDLEWKIFYRELRKKYGNPLDDILVKHGLAA